MFTVLTVAPTPVDVSLPEPFLAQPWLVFAGGFAFVLIFMGMFLFQVRLTGVTIAAAVGTVALLVGGVIAQDVASAAHAERVAAATQQAVSERLADDYDVQVADRRGSHALPAARGDSEVVLLALGDGDRLCDVALDDIGVVVRCDGDLLQPGAGAPQS